MTFIKLLTFGLIALFVWLLAQNPWAASLWM
jgi:hypothetical protein